MGARVEIGELLNRSKRVYSSLPSWERGLKFKVAAYTAIFCKVAPLVGARVEIRAYVKLILLYTVAPLVGARVEMAVNWKCRSSPSVAPLVGARVEIHHVLALSAPIYVAPLVGARVEISSMRPCARGAGSLPSWERGLKFVILDYKSDLLRCRSPRGSAD